MDEETAKRVEKMKEYAKIPMELVRKIVESQEVDADETD